MILEANFSILREMTVQLDENLARIFYAEHSGRGFFNRLVKYMTSFVWAGYGEELRSWFRFSSICYQGGFFFLRRSAVNRSVSYSFVFCVHVGNYKFVLTIQI
ncbi:hypothetical protein MKW94_022665 [Papaver nudicaule]|uniref:Nucleoside diphosphate kinase-like domain-containing protein n=1 Tax=Papaver nudicaule TaxID=74823 RepID=A0AA41VJ98_PAPNU|nr:hypothetical protein [Papaver nudicaule]MCL7050961.1 hypothetical protein [Papaver nudicaule]